MIPVLYKANETNFNHNGLGLLVDIIYCYAEESRNGSYEIELAYPINSFLYKELKGNSLIKAKANDRYNPQLFRIYYISKPMNGKIIIKAEHISYKAKDNFVENLNYTGNCQGALNALNNATTFESGFTFFSDITMSANFKAEIKNLWTCIIGSEGSIIDTYGKGADIVRDNFNISVKQNGGQDNNVLIAYKKNLTGFTCEEDWTNCITAIYPYVDKDDSRIILTEKYVYSDYITRDPNPRIVAIDFKSDFGDEEEITEAALRLKANEYFTKNKCDVPSLNYNIEFVTLSKTEEYRDSGISEEVGLFDSVIIRHELYNINTKIKVIKDKYDTLAEKHVKLELDSSKLNVTTIINNTKQEVKETKKDLETAKKKITVKMEELEEGIKLSVTEEDLWALIEMNPGKILLAVNDGENGTDVTITPEDGLSVYKNKFQMFNTDGKKIFGVNTSGRALIYEMVEIADDDGRFTDLSSSRLTFWNEDYLLARVDCIEDQNGMLVLESKRGDVLLSGKKILINGTTLEDFIDERIANA